VVLAVALAAVGEYILVIALGSPYLNHKAIYLSIYFCRIWPVCACTTVGEWQRMDLRM
jgi:hypothetical protein